MINKVIILGNVGKDPEVRVLESGAKVVRVPVATNENYQDRNTGEWNTVTTWHDVVLWRALADRAERQLKTGSLVYIEGKISKRKYTDKDNIERYTTEVVANTLRSLDKRESSSDYDKPQSRPSSSASSSESPSPTAGDALGEEDDDLPF